LLSIFFLTVSLFHYFKPHALKVTDFLLGTNHQGLRTIQLLGLPTDKTHKISFGCTSVRQDFVGAHTLVENPPDDLCGVKLIFYYINDHLPPGYTGRLFLRRACQKELRKRLKVGNKREAGIGEQYYFGKNYCNVLCKQLAHRVKLDFPNQQTAKSLCRSAITTMCDKLPGGMLRAASRHANAETNARYQTETDESRNARATVFHYQPRTEQQQQQEAISSISPQEKESTPVLTATAVPVASTTNYVPNGNMHAQVYYVPQPPFVQQQQPAHVPQPPFVHQQQPAPGQYMFPMAGATQFQHGNHIFPGTVAHYPQQFPGSAPQCPPNYHQQQP
jgi:hypothetical protein